MNKNIKKVIQRKVREMQKKESYREILSE